MKEENEKEIPEGFDEQGNIKDQEKIKNLLNPETITEKEILLAIHQKLTDIEKLLQKQQDKPQTTPMAKQWE